MKRVSWMVTGAAAVVALAGVAALAAAGVKGEADSARGGVVTVRGMLQAIVHDDFENGGATLDYALRERGDDGKSLRSLDLVFPQQPAEMPIGKVVEVSGTLENGTLTVLGAPKVLSVDGDRRARPRPGEVEASHAANVTHHDMLVIIANLTGNSSTCTKTGAENTLLYNADSVKEFYWEQSFHQLELNGDVVGPTTLQASGTQCRENTWKNQANSWAATQQVVIDHGGLDSYDSIAYAFPAVPGTNCTGATGGDGVITMFGECNDHGFAHELGHVLGVAHAFTADPVPQGCLYYCDTSTTMGNMIGYNLLRHFNGPEKVQAGWIPNGPAPAEDRVLEVTTSGLYTISLLEADIAGTNQILNIENHQGSGGDYYISYRTSYGTFGGNVSTNYRPKMNVHDWMGGYGSTHFFGSDAYNSQAFADGQTWVEPNEEVCVTMVSHTDTLAHIWVSLDCQASPPPVCPSVSSCNGTSCLQGLETGSTNTGYVQCVTGQGTLLACTGQTVHVVSNNCNRAACCTASPNPCFCPQTCPSGTRLECR
jgi:hypothetical protein